MNIDCSLDLGRATMLSFTCMNFFRPNYSISSLVSTYFARLLVYKFSFYIGPLDPSLPSLLFDIACEPLDGLERKMTAVSFFGCFCIYIRIDFL